MAPPPIIIKRKAPHSAYHGGAWKVAYADFVTAMMALFIVLWLMSSSDPVRRAVAGYFSDPRGRSADTGTDRSGTADNLPLTRENISQLKERLENSIRKMSDLKSVSKQVEMTVTPEGLRVARIEERDVF